MTVLDSIIEGVREDLDVRRRARAHTDLLSLLADAPAPLDALSALRAASGVAVIAEVKRASPSKGHLGDITDPAALAATYESGGAAAVSVLTEARRFNGSLADLDAVRARVSIPILRKDFMVDPYQVTEARVHGADLILLIAAALDDALMKDLFEQATELGMTSLFEVHDAAELARVLALGPSVVGINARNLKTLEVSSASITALLPEVPEDIVAVAESGIVTSEDVADHVRHGAGAVLVGEALVTGGDPAGRIREFTRAAVHARGEKGQHD